MTSITFSPALAQRPLETARLSAFERCVVFALTLFFFSNVAVHGFLFGGWPVQPAMIFGAACVTLAPIIYARGGLRFLASPPAYWCVGFIAVSVGWFVMFGGDALPSMLGRCYAGLFLLFFFAVFSMDSTAVHVGRLALAWGVVLAALCNVYEVLNPTAFLPAGFFFGRAAGFYINPNQTGAALVLGTVLGLGVVTPRIRWLFLAVSMGAIALTLSRAAVVLWVAALGVLVVLGTVRVRTVAAAVALVGATAYAAWLALADFLLRTKGVNLELLLERVGFFTTVSSVPDYSQLERAAVAEKAWLLFEEHLLRGAGLGSTETWSELASTHNMYLYFMADYGLVGAIIYPALILAVAGRVNVAARPYAPAFATLAILWGLFSHNIVGELYSLLSFALMAAWARAGEGAASPGIHSPSRGT